jgi:DNA-binding response OmpR family regulator
MRSPPHITLLGDDPALAAILDEEAQDNHAFVFSYAGKNASSSPPDIFILSADNAKQLAALEAVLALQKKESDAPCFLVTPENYEAVTQTPYENILQKPFRLSALLDAAVAVWRKRQLKQTLQLSPHVVFRAFEKTIEDGQSKMCIHLTDKEALFLLAVVEAGEEGLSRAGALTDIWGYHEEADSHAVETTLYRLRQKLQEIFGKTEVLAVRQGAYVWRV